METAAVGFSPEKKKPQFVYFFRFARREEGREERGRGKGIEVGEKRVREEKKFPCGERTVQAVTSSNDIYGSFYLRLFVIEPKLEFSRIYATTRRSSVVAGFHDLVVSSLELSHSFLLLSGNEKARLP